MSWHHIERGEGRPLVLLHGIGSEVGIWSSVLDRLAAERRVVAFDFPGFGATPPAPDGAEPWPGWFAAGLPAQLEAVGIEAPVDIVGHSMGGWTALEAAKLGLARAVVALCPAGLWRGAMPPRQHRTLRFNRVAARLLKPIASPLARVPPIRAIGLASVLSHPLRMPADDALRATRAYADAPGYDASLAGMARHRFEHGAAIAPDVPVTVAFGTRERLLTATSQLRDELPAHARWVDLPGCGHLPIWDDAELTARVILEGTT